MREAQREITSAADGSIPSDNGGASAFISFSGVCKSDDGRHQVVERLDLAVRKGEFLTMLGPSGSGKTTTLMMLAGFEKPSAGSITLDGKDITRVPPHARDIGVVFQNYALFPHMSVLDNVRFPLSVRSVTRLDQAERARRALATVRLEGVEGRRPTELSGGQQQRVAIARALVFDPKLILMDEPLGALDRVLREQMQVELKHLHRMLGITVIYVTHDQSEAIALSDRVAVFNKGKIAQIGSAEDLYERPGNEFVAGFLGENNIIRASLVESGARESVVALGDDTLKCRPTALPAGEKVSVSIRPERIVLRKSPRSLSCENILSGKVVDRMYFGDHLKYQISIASGAVLSVKVAVADDV
ncbi:MAG: ABC transporter ATP-binding protein, partial [Parvibaculaceae bacterium]